MASLRYLFRSAGTTLFRPLIANANATAQFDPSLCTMPILDATKAKGDRSTDAITLIGFVLTTVFVISKVYNLRKWLWLEETQLRTNERKVIIETI